MSRPQAVPGTIVLYADIACPFAHLATYRLWRARSELGLTDDVVIDERALPLELVNQEPTPKLTFDAEIPVLGALDPEAGWQMWQEPGHEWPVTSLLALEAVQAAKRQHIRAGEALARALRRAMFGESRCVSLRSVILEVADRCEGIDTGVLARDLDSGADRATVVQHWADKRDGPVEVSPHLFLPDGSDHPNPGMEVHWEGEPGRGLLIVDSDDPGIYRDLVRRAAG